MPTNEEKNRFSKTIEYVVSETGYTYMEAILEHCKKYGLEFEVAASLISLNLKAKIENDAQQRNMLRGKGAKLPI